MAGRASLHSREGRAGRHPVAVDNDSALAAVLRDIPRDADRLIVLYPTSDGQTACRWFGMSAEQVAMTLYQLADGVVEQRLPLRPRKP